MRFLIYSENKKIPFKNVLVEKLSDQIVLIDEIPEHLEFNEVLIVYFEEVSRELLEQVRYSDLQFITISPSYNIENFKRVFRSGGSNWVNSNLSDEEFRLQLIDLIEMIKAQYLLHSLSHTELELFRFIARNFNGKKSRISDIVFGATSELTLDVNLSRLRKKLKDPDVGNDFFRILTKEGRLHLVNRLNDYQYNP